LRAWERSVKKWWQSPARRGALQRYDDPTRSGRTTMPFDPDEYELDDDDLPAGEDFEPESDDARDDVSEERIGFRES
jgi:hypothetical protein